MADRTSTRRKETSSEQSSLDDRLSKLEFNPMAVPKGKFIWDYYPKLLRRRQLYAVPKDIFKEIGEKVPTESDLDKLIRIICLFCAENSPFFDITDYTDRLYACCSLLDIGEKDPIFIKMEKGHWWCADVMSAYLQMENNEPFQNWMALKINAHNQRKYLMLPFSDSADPDKMMSSQQKVGQMLLADQGRLADLEARLFPDSRAAQMVKESIMADEVGGWAEDYAQDFKFNFL